MRPNTGSIVRRILEGGLALVVALKPGFGNDQDYNDPKGHLEGYIGDVRTHQDEVFAIKHLADNVKFAYWVDKDGFFDISSRIDEYNNRIVLGKSDAKIQKDAKIVISTTPLTEDQYEANPKMGGVFDLNTFYHEGRVYQNVNSRLNRKGSPSSEGFQDAANYLTQNRRDADTFVASYNMGKTFLADLKEYVNHWYGDDNISNMSRTDARKATAIMKKVLQNKVVKRMANWNEVKLDPLRKMVANYK
tara:strand:- start:5768 stop:6508 length:741 start_codon:yes stop_codon:yes gene_type:complete